MQINMQRRLKTENIFSVKVNHSNKILEPHFSHMTGELISFSTYSYVYILAENFFIPAYHSPYTFERFH